MWPLRVLSWLVAAYFGVGFAIKAGFPPKTDSLIGDALFVLITLFFLFLPFFNKIKLGSWLELEREVKEAKKEAAAATEELREFKAEVRNTVSVISTNKMSQQVNLLLPGAQQMRDQQEEIGKRLSVPAQENVEAIEEDLQTTTDTLLALAKVRIDIERLLRTIVGKRLDAYQGTRPPEPIKFMSIEKMFAMLIQEDKSLSYLRAPLRSVLAVCNAAIHAQNVSLDQADEALTLGAQVIAALKQYPGAQTIGPA